MQRQGDLAQVLRHGRYIVEGNKLVKGAVQERRGGRGAQGDVICGVVGG